MGARKVWSLLQITKWRHCIERKKVKINGRKKWYENLDDAIITKKSDVSPKESKKNLPLEFAGDTGRALAQGLSFGTADEMEAGARALYAKFIEGKDFNTAYNETVKEIRSDISQFREDNPKTAYGTEIAGNIPTGAFATLKLAKLGFTL